MLWLDWVSFHAWKERPVSRQSLTVSKHNTLHRREWHTCGFCVLHCFILMFQCTFMFLSSYGWNRNITNFILNSTFYTLLSFYVAKTYFCSWFYIILSSMFTERKIKKSKEELNWSPTPFNNAFYYFYFGFCNWWRQSLCFFSCHTLVWLVSA